MRSLMLMFAGISSSAESTIRESSWTVIDAWSATFGALVAAVATALVTFLIETLRDGRRLTNLKSKAAAEIGEVLNAVVRNEAEVVTKEICRHESTEANHPQRLDLVGVFSFEAVELLVSSPDRFGSRTPRELAVMLAHFRTLTGVIDEANRNAADWETAAYHGNDPWTTRKRKNLLSSMKALQHQGKRFYDVGLKTLRLLDKKAADVTYPWPHGEPESPPRGE